MRVLALALSVVLLAGCQSAAERQADLERRAEERAARAREYIDDLATRVGTSATVLQNEMATCDPSSDDGLDLIYALRVEIDASAPDRLRGEIADHFEAEGWEVRRDSDDSDSQRVRIRFLKPPYSMGADISVEHGVASVGGSGGCVD